MERSRLEGEIHWSDPQGQQGWRGVWKEEERERERGERDREKEKVSEEEEKERVLS